MSYDNYNSNPAGKAPSQVGAGPRVGNKTLGDKRESFIKAKDAFKAMSDTISDRYAARGDRTRGHIAPHDDSIMPNVKTGRGPTKG
jgi:hypothetical protein